MRCCNRACAHGLHAPSAACSCVCMCKLWALLQSSFPCMTMHAAITVCMQPQQVQPSGMVPHPAQHTCCQACPMLACVHMPHGPGPNAVAATVSQLKHEMSINGKADAMPPIRSCLLSPRAGPVTGPHGVRQLGCCGRREQCTPGEGPRPILNLTGGPLACPCPTRRQCVPPRTPSAPALPGCPLFVTGCIASASSPFPPSPLHPRHHPSPHRRCFPAAAPTSFPPQKGKERCSSSQRGAERSGSALRPRPAPPAAAPRWW